MKKQLTVILFTTCVLSVVLTLLAIFVILSNRPVSVSMQRCDMSGIFYGVGIFTVLGMSVASTTMYFNLFQSIKVNVLYSLLSFLLLPLLAAVTLIIAIGDFKYSWREDMALVLPFLAIQFIQFVRFRQKTQQIQS